MKLLNKKGFILVETLIVTLFVLTLFILVYQNLVPSLGEYERMSSYENYGKVYSLFLRIRKNRNITINEFVKEKKLELYNYFFEESLETEEQIKENNKIDIYVAQIISYAILKRNNIIKKIKEGAGLCWLNF